MLEKYQIEFINFLLSANVLQFGEFKLKSGRLAPYFINAANFNNGELISELGRFYADHIVSSNLGKIDNIFGPAYKGIPLAVTTCISLFKNHDIKCGYSFDRKETKLHGDGGKIVGMKLEKDMRLVIVEDVITAGTTLSEIVPALRNSAEVEIAAVVISVDREEKGSSNTSALKEIQDRLGIKILPIVAISQIIDYLASPQAGIYTLDSDILDRIAKYRSEYAAK